MRTLPQHREADQFARESGCDKAATGGAVDGQASEPIARQSIQTTENKNNTITTRGKATRRLVRKSRSPIVQHVGSRR